MYVMYMNSQQFVTTPYEVTDKIHEEECEDGNNPRTEYFYVVDNNQVDDILRYNTVRIWNLLHKNIKTSIYDTNESAYGQD